MGFTLIKMKWQKKKNEATWNDFIIEKWEYWNFTGNEGIKMSIDIKYVHQLQNLYYALTGEELEIKK